MFFVAAIVMVLVGGVGMLKGDGDGRGSAAASEELKVRDGLWDVGWRVRKGRCVGVYALSLSFWSCDLSLSVSLCCL